MIEFGEKGSDRWELGVVEGVGGELELFFTFFKWIISLSCNGSSYHKSFGEFEYINTIFEGFVKKKSSFDSMDIIIVGNVYLKWFNQLQQGISCLIILSLCLIPPSHFTLT